MSKRNLFNLVAVHVGWIACVVGAGRGVGWLGPAVVVALIVWHLAMAKQVLRECAVIAVVTLIGSVVDSVQMWFGVLHFDNQAANAWLVPWWMVALWGNFGTALTVILRVFWHRCLLASIIGAVAAGVTYQAGERLGALRLGDGFWRGAGAIGIEWLVLLPVLLWVTRSILEPPEHPTREE